MICYRCGHNVPERALRCSNCGAELGSATRALKLPRGSIKALRAKRAQADAGEIPFQVGDPIAGRYEVREALGKGPFGILFKTFDQELESEVAVKVLHARWFLEDASQTRFEAVVRQARRLSHPNIARLYDSGFDRGHAFVAMQLLEGLHLGKVLGLRQEKKEPFSLAEVAPLLRQVEKALEYAHKTTFHGGLRPENIILQPERLKLTDFFMRDAVGPEAFVKAVNESSYLAPELRGDPDAGDARSDVYAVAVMFAELLAGQPFTEGFVQPRTLNPALPEAVDDVMAAATAADPAHRTASLAAFSEALTAASTSDISDADILDADMAEAVLLDDVEGDFSADNTSVYRLTEEDSFNPLDIPTPMDIGEGPAISEASPRLDAPARREGTIVLNPDEDLEVVGDDEVGMTEVNPSLQRPMDVSDAPTEAMPPLQKAEGGSVAPDSNELETTEQPRAEVLARTLDASAAEVPSISAPEPAIAPGPASGDGDAVNSFDELLAGTPPKRRSFMKPVKSDQPTAELNLKDNRNTERLRAMPPTKPRGEAAQGSGSFTWLLVAVAFFLFIGVLGFVIYSNGKIGQRSAETINNFGQNASAENP